MTIEMKKSIIWVVMIACLGIAFTLIYYIIKESITIQDVYYWINASQMLLSC